MTEPVTKYCIGVSRKFANEWNKTAPADERFCYVETNTYWGYVMKKVEVVEMNLNEYQTKALTTAVYPNRGAFLGLNYTVLKLNGEAGEVAEKVGKIMRDDGSEISDAAHAHLVKELGDVLWYIAAAANELGVDLQTVADWNLTKLASRKERNVLSGSGDER